MTTQITEAYDQLTVRRKTLIKQIAYNQFFYDLRHPFNFRWGKEMDRLRSELIDVDEQITAIEISFELYKIKHPSPIPVT